MPIYGNGERIGTLIVAKYDREFNDEDLLLAEYAAAVIGVEILHERAARVEEEARKKAMVQIAFSTLSFSELEAITSIMDALHGTEGRHGRAAGCFQNCRQRWHYALRYRQRAAQI